MPFAGFKDFDDCVAKQKANGKSDESAKKICGFIKARTEKLNILHEKICGKKEAIEDETSKRFKTKKEALDRSGYKALQDLENTFNKLARSMTSAEMKSFIAKAKSMGFSANDINEYLGDNIAK